MAVTNDIVSTWWSPRPVILRKVSEGPREDRALVYLMVACLLIFVSSLPRLARMLGKGGTLAVQMPHQNKSPSHRVWLSLAEELFPDRVEKMGTPGVMAPVKYEELLAKMGQFRLWETEYFQRLGAETGSHPVRRFTESTYARPILEALNAEEKADIISRYEEVMHAAYPVRNDGSVLFPFRRMFFTLTV